MSSTTSIICLDPELDEYEQTYTVYISDEDIYTTVTRDSDIVNKWISTVEHANNAEPQRLIVGLDVKLGTPIRYVALLVLYVYGCCLIFQLPYANSVPFPLRQFLSNRNNTLVGVGIESKLAQLQQEYDGLGRGARHVDLGTLVAAQYNRPNLNYVGLSRLRTFLRGGDVQRPPVTDNWDEPLLSTQHVHHACIDAYVCYELGIHVMYGVTD
ncbi:hypothetical protein ACS0TY_018251 [Phlomoides rotata]